MHAKMALAGRGGLEPGEGVSSGGLNSPPGALFASHRGPTPSER